jgi:hypothetical protein
MNVWKKYMNEFWGKNYVGGKIINFGVPLKYISKNNNPMILDLISEYLNFKGGRNLRMNTMLCEMYDDLKIRSRQEI